MSSRTSQEKENTIHAVVSPLREQFADQGDHVFGLDLYEKAQDISLEEKEKRSIQVRRKIDMYVMPVLCVTYMLQFLDKLSLNYASAYTLREDLGLEGQRYSWVAAIFNFGYLFWAFPANYILQKVPVAKYTSAMLFVWAILLVAHVGAKNYGGILVLRFLLGMFEASISPSCMMICSLLYTRKEQPFRMCTFLSFNGVASMVGGLLGYGLGHSHNSHLKEWQLIFLTIGLMNLAWSVVFFFMCPDSPSNAWFLNETEKAIAVERVANNSMGIKDSTFKKSQAWEAIKDPFAYMICLCGMTCGIINGGTSNFQSSLLRGFGYSGIDATLLQIPTGAVELALVFGSGLVALFITGTRLILLLITCIPGLVGLILIHTLPLSAKHSLLGAIWMLYTIGAPVILSWITINANIAGQTKKTVVTSAWFALYAAGNIIGANIFYAYQAPKYQSGMIGCIVSYVAMMVLSIMMYFLFVFRNKKRDREFGEQTAETKEQSVIDGFKGYTDFENTGFRYVL